jgi:5'-3' exoribonuclease 2
MSHPIQGKAKEKQGEFDEKTVTKKPYQFLHINVLREYLEHQLSTDQLPFGFDLERALDDWVFLCFFVGNDFLPHLPTLEIRENAIGLLSEIYKKVLPSTGYLTDNGFIHFDRVELVLREVALLEDNILVTRLEKEKAIEARKKRRAQEARMSERGGLKRSHDEDKTDDSDRNQMKNNEAAASLRAALLNETSSPSSSSEQAAKKQRVESGAVVTSTSEKSDLSTSTDSQVTEEVQPEDPVRLGEQGWKERYYKVKFGVGMNDTSFFKKFSEAYAQGLLWVLQYYYRGCCSWTWFFPYHYAPFTSELRDLKEHDLKFELGKPFKPYEQLMGVLPAASGTILPASYHNLMTDPDSPIIDFYPQNFVIDLNGKKQSWMGVALLPFIDEQRLLDALKPLESTFTEEEKMRNSIGTDLLFVHSSHPLSSQLASLPSPKEDKNNATPVWIDMDSKLSGGMFGKVQSSKHNYLDRSYPLPFEGLEEILQCKVICCNYGIPPLPEGQDYKRGLLPDVVLPPRILSPSDFMVTSPYYRQQNSSARRMINHTIGDSRQYKSPTQPYPVSRPPQEYRDNRYRTYPPSSHDIRHYDRDSRGRDQRDENPRYRDHRSPQEYRYDSKQRDYRQQQQDYRHDYRQQQQDYRHDSRQQDYRHHSQQGYR